MRNETNEKKVLTVHCEIQKRNAESKVKNNKTKQHPHSFSQKSGSVRVRPVSGGQSERIFSKFGNSVIQRRLLLELARIIQEMVNDLDLNDVKKF
jgi:hypothetical protein